MSVMSVTQKKAGDREGKPNREGVPGSDIIEKLQ